MAENKNIPMFNDTVQLQVRNKVLNSQAEEIGKNERILEIVDSDLNTVRRHVEIIEDSSLRKGNHLFLLKTILTFTGLTFIPLVLKSQAIIDEKYTKYSLYTLAFLFVIIVLYNFLSVRVRNSNRFNLRNFFQRSRSESDKSIIPKRTCLSKQTFKMTPEEQELERKLQLLQKLELRFNRIQPKINILQSRSKSTQDEMDKIKSEYREIFGADASDKAIETAIRNRLDQRNQSLV